MAIETEILETCLNCGKQFKRPRELLDTLGTSNEVKICDNCVPKEEKKDVLSSKEDKKVVPTLKSKKKKVVPTKKKK